MWLAAPHHLLYAWTNCYNPFKDLNLYPPIMIEVFTDRIRLNILVAIVINVTLCTLLVTLLMGNSTFPMQCSDWSLLHLGGWNLNSLEIDTLLECRIINLWMFFGGEGSFEEFLPKSNKSRITSLTFLSQVARVTKYHNRPWKTMWERSPYTLPHRQCVCQIRLTQWKALLTSHGLHWCMHITDQTGASDIRFQMCRAAEYCS